jgi:hypothetical protein
MTPASIGAVINSLSFRFARTMPEIPHEYVVRSPDNEAAYVALFTAIMGHGVYECWAGHCKAVSLSGRRLEILGDDHRAPGEPGHQPHEDRRRSGEVAPRRLDRPSRRTEGTFRYFASALCAETHRSREDNALPAMVRAELVLDFSSLAAAKQLGETEDAR